MGKAIGQLSKTETRFSLALSELKPLLLRAGHKCCSNATSFAHVRILGTGGGETRGRERIAQLQDHGHLDLIGNVAYKIIEVT